MNLQTYIKEIRKEGQRCFTIDEVVSKLQISRNYARVSLHRLLKSGDLISPVQGLYVIIPPEHQPYGSIPAEELVPLIMKHLNTAYYVALLSAATYFGASHQKPAHFQVMSNKRIKHSLEFGQVAIELIYRHSLTGLPTQDFNVSTGYLKVATPELIAIDLFKYMKRAGGISHITTVLSELIERIDGNKLLSLAENMGEQCQIQRIGYVVEKIEVMDEDKQHMLVNKLRQYLENSDRPFVSLVPSMPRTESPRCKKWKIIENSDFESDI